METGEHHTDTSLIYCKGGISEGGSGIHASPDRDNKWEIQQNKEENTPPTSLFYCKGGISEGENKETGVLRASGADLPESIAKRLEEYAEANLRPGKSTARFMKFAAGFIREIGVGGTREINEKTLLRVAGKEADADTSFLKRWKGHLVGAGILRKGWEENIIRGVRSSKYKLTGWVTEDLNGKASPAPWEGRGVVRGLSSLTEASGHGELAGEAGIPNESGCSVSRADYSGCGWAIGAAALVGSKSVGI